MRYSVVLFFVLAVLIVRAESKQPHFALYIALDEKADIQSTRLGNKPLLTENDVIAYDWATHTITLTEAGQHKIPVSWDKTFIVVANGERCYRGAFWSAILSQSHPEPVIDVYKRKQTIRIERAYPSAEFAKGPDPRFDPRIKRALEEAGKLK